MKEIKLLARLSGKRETHPDTNNDGKFVESLITEPSHVCCIGGSYSFLTNIERIVTFVTQGIAFTIKSSKLSIYVGTIS